MGVVNYLTPPGGALDQALDLAASLTDGPPEAQAAIKSLISAPDSDRIAAHLDRERGAMARALGRDEAQEGISAFQEKRNPSFPDLFCGPGAGHATARSPRSHFRKSG